jgi:hypothetical protein
MLIQCSPEHAVPAKVAARFGIRPSSVCGGKADKEPGCSLLLFVSDGTALQPTAGSAQSSSTYFYRSRQSRRSPTGFALVHTDLGPAETSRAVALVAIVELMSDEAQASMISLLVPFCPQCSWRAGENVRAKATWWPKLRRGELTGDLRREDVNRHGGQIKADMPTTVLRQANLAMFHLPLPGFALQLPHHFNNLAQSCCPNGMSSRQEPS